MIIAVKKLSESAQMPTQGSANAAGWDLYADIEKDIIVYPGCREKISTGLAMEIPTGYWGGIYARSGKACNEGIRPANCVGVIDDDYRGPVIVCLTNDDLEPKIIKKGERIAQFILHKKEYIAWEEVEELNNTERADGGFGHSGKF